MEKSHGHNIIIKTKRNSESIKPPIPPHTMNHNEKQKFSYLQRKVFRQFFTQSGLEQINYHVVLSTAEATNLDRCRKRHPRLITHRNSANLNLHWLSCSRHHKRRSKIYCFERCLTDVYDGSKVVQSWEKHRTWSVIVAIAGPLGILQNKIHSFARGSLEQHTRVFVYYRGSGFVARNF